MCFSLEVSALASGILLTAGTVSTVHAWKTPKRYFAMIPLFFGIQQGIEALQWMADKPSLCSTTLGYGFLFFAFLIWPVFTPFAYWIMEKDAKHKLWLGRFTLLGACGSLFLLLCMLTLPLAIFTANHHIVYDIPVPFVAIGIPLYLLSVCTGFFSTRFRARFLAATTLFGFCITLAAYMYAFTSVWCFFAAIFSGIVLWEVFAKEQKKK